MELNNLQRDMTWVDTPQGLTAPTQQAFGTIVAKTDGVTNDKHGWAQTAAATLAGTAGQFYSFGLAMTWKEAGTTPYRVKACSSVAAYFGFGWNGTVATSMTATSPRICAYGTEWDDVVAVRELAAWTDEQLCFFMCVPADAGKHWGSISVQNLIGKPDQYSAQVY